MDDGVLESELLDVTDIELDQLDALPDSVLSTALRRVLTERIDIPDLYTITPRSL